MTTLTRFRDWWMGQYRNQRGLDRLVWVGAPLLFSCCICSLALAAIAPGGDAEPTAEVADRAAATADLSAPTTAPAATDEPTTTTRPTARPTNTARPTATDEPTRPPVRAATALAETVVADQLTVTAAPLTATRPPAPATNPPPTATAVRAATVALPTATQPPSSPAPTAVSPTAVPSTAVPSTEPPQPTAPLPAASGDVVISSVRYNGDINPQEPDEYAVITNRGGTIVNLGGWRLNAGEPDQNFGFPSFDLQPGQSCRVYTNQVNADSCGGGTFGSGQAIWNNGGDCGVLYNAEGAEVSRYCW